MENEPLGFAYIMNIMSATLASVAVCDSHTYVCCPQLIGRHRFSLFLSHSLSSFQFILWVYLIDWFIVVVITHYASLWYAKFIATCQIRWTREERDREEARCDRIHF